MATFPQFTCRAFANGTTVCAPVGVGRWTWAGTPQTALGWEFAPLAGVFTLPRTLWLLYGFTEWDAFRVLVGTSAAPVLGFVDRVLVAVESLSDGTCPSGRRLFLTRRAVDGMAELSREALNCEWHQNVPSDSRKDASYGALGVKWMGPWEDGDLFTADDLETHEYYRRGEQAVPRDGDTGLEHTYEGGGGYRQIITKSGLLPCRTPFTNQLSLLDVAEAAAENGDIACLQELVPSRIDPDAAVWQGVLLGRARSRAAVAALLAAGAHVNGRQGETPPLSD